jgi:hypothetical protein
VDVRERVDSCCFAQIKKGLFNCKEGREREKKKRERESEREDRKRKRDLIIKIMVPQCRVAQLVNRKASTNLDHIVLQTP